MADLPPWIACGDGIGCLSIMSTFGFIRYFPVEPIPLSSDEVDCRLSLRKEWADRSEVDDPLA